MSKVSLFRPPDMFDREFEWGALVGFALDGQPGATLGLVSGRWRQGKSFLVESLCEAAGGFYFAATEATEAESLRRFGAELAAHTGALGELAYSSWDAAIDALLALGRDRAMPVVIDEFPFLCAATPALPSIIQKSYGPRRAERVESRTRLLLCGSALSFMGQLLSGSAPLRGRAGLDLTVPTFGYRRAAEFWGISDPRLAIQVHAVVGGTPAYRREYVRGDAPTRADDFDAWVARTVLNPSSPLFKEARYLLAEESQVRDRALYHSVLAAIAQGRTTRGGIASYVGRSADMIAHPLLLLQDVGFVTREDDAFRDGRSYFRIAEPLVAFYHAVMRPEWSRLERPGSSTEIWRQSSSRFSVLLGSHFEHLVRSWVREYASEATLGGRIARVCSGVINDAKARSAHEVDIVAVGSSPVQGRQVLVIGEAKWGEVMGVSHLVRLQKLRALLETQTDLDVRSAKLLCASGTGFTPELEDSQKTGDVILLDPTRLYFGT